MGIVDGCSAVARKLCQCDALYWVENLVHSLKIWWLVPKDRSSLTCNRRAAQHVALQPIVQSMRRVPAESSDKRGASAKMNLL